MKIYFGKPIYDTELGLWYGPILGCGDTPGPGPGPTPTKETYAIVNDLFSMTGLTFDWVWDKKTEKWYRYNDQGMYEEYGIIADSIEPAEIAYGATFKKNAYFNTECPVTSATRVTVDFIIPSTVSSNQFVFGARNESSASVACRMSLFLNTSGKIRIDIGNKIWETLSYQKGMRYKVVMEYNYPKANYWVYETNGRDYEYLISTGTTSVTTYDINYPIYIGGLDYGGNFGSENTDATVISMLIENIENGEWVKTKDFVFHNENNVPVLYDKLSETERTYLGTVAPSLYTTTTGTSTYKGKLAVVDNMEYEWNGKKWVEIGEGFSVLDKVWATPLKSDASYNITIPITNLTKNWSFEFNAQATGYYNGGAMIQYSGNSLRWFDTSSTLYYSIVSDSGRFQVSSTPFTNGYNITMTIGDHYMTGTVGSKVINNSASAKKASTTSGNILINLGQLKWRNFIVKDGGETRMSLIPGISPEGVAGFHDEINDAWYVNTALTMAYDSRTDYPKDYDYPEPIASRVYDTMEDFNADTEKYGNCIVTILNPSRVFFYTYDKRIVELTDDYKITFKATSKVEPASTSAADFGCNYMATIYDDSTQTGQWVFDDIPTKIGSAAFQNNTALVEVQLPANISTIGNHAFYGCSNLLPVSLDNLTTIQTSAFQNNPKITGSLVIPPSVTTLNSSAFNNTKITSVSGGENVTTLGGAFPNCTSLITADLSKMSNAKLSSSIFNSCSNLTSVILPKNCVRFNEYCFNNCKALNNITISADYIYTEGMAGGTYGYSTFAGTGNITGITVNNLWSFVRQSKFNTDYSCCWQTTNSQKWHYVVNGVPVSGALTDESGVTELRPEIFRNYAPDLTSVTINYATKIYSRAFAGCKGLQRVHITSPVTLISSDMYRYNGSITTGGGAAFDSCTSLTSFVMEDASKLTAMHTTFLAYCTALTEIRMPGLTKAFNISTCTGMTEEGLVALLNDLGTVSSVTITLGATNLAKLSEEEIAIATAKGWIVA